MNKKGFTLVELLAVIALLAILSLITTPAIMVVRNKLLKNSLESKINLILSAAEDYASEHIMQIPSDTENCSDYSCCHIVLVKTLISNGYLVGDSQNKEVLINPLSEESLNYEKVCIRYDNNDVSKRKIISFMLNEDELLK